MEARATELMETEDGYVESSSEVEMNDDALSNYQGGIHEMNCDKEYDAPSTSQGGTSNQSGVGVVLERGGTGGLIEGWRSGKEEFANITLMISRWEAQEEEEATPVVEMVRTRRRSTKLDTIVRELNIESDEDNLTAEKSKWRNSSGATTFVPFFSNKQNIDPNISGAKQYQIQDKSKPRPKQTISLWDTRKNGGGKRKIENESGDYECNRAKRWCRSGPGMYK